MELKTNKKILFIVLFFLFFIVLDNKCFASIEVNYNNNSYSLPDFKSFSSYFFIVYDSDVNNFFLYDKYNSSIFTTYQTYNGSSNSLYVSNSLGSNFSKYEVSNNSWTSVSSSTSDLLLLENSSPNVIHNEIVFSSCDIYTNDSLTSIYYMHDSSLYSNPLGINLINEDDFIIVYDWQLNNFVLYGFDFDHSLPPTEEHIYYSTATYNGVSNVQFFYGKNFHIYYWNNNSWEDQHTTTRRIYYVNRYSPYTYFCTPFWRTVDIYGLSNGANSYADSNIKFRQNYFPDNNVYETPTLYIDDMNLRKRFSWQFEIPMVRDDTKYYVFLEDYNRISYSSVQATFRIFTVTTPEDYDYTDYENYMYYDNLEKKLYLPAGCEIKEYSCTGTNGDLYSLTLEDDFTAERDNKIFYDSETLRENIFLGLGNSFSQFNNSSLFPTNTLFFDYNPREVAFNLLSPLATLYNKTIAKLLPFIRF